MTGAAPSAVKASRTTASSGERMKRNARLRAGLPALELIEAATHLLRTAPVATLLSYYAGSIPCVLGLLYFWTEMSGGAFAREHLVEDSLGAALLYLWMKCWHTIFASKLRVHLAQEPETPWTFPRVARLVSIQATVQPSGLFLRLVAAQILFPYVWTYAFYQNVGILGDGAGPGLGDTVRQAMRQARLWPRQAHSVLAFLFLFAFFIWLNICIFFAAAPSLLNTFFGIETIFSHNLFAMLNTTTFAATAAATYLCFDPLRKAVFVLRCFHGVSLSSAEDLRLELRSWRKSSRRVGMVIMLLASFSLGPLAPVRAADPPKPAAQVESSRLDDSVQRVLQRPEYAWRLPRKASAEEEGKSGIAAFFESLWKKAGDLVKAFRRGLDRIARWMDKLFHRKPKDESSSSSEDVDHTAIAQIILIILVVALVLICALLLWFRHKGRTDQANLAAPTTAIPDLNEESVTADQLPEDGWLALARKLMDNGELRLALRAFYLATLAHLGHRELIRLARHKSNRDYDCELQRRARGNAGLLDAFDANLAVFERAWYGEHEVTPVTLDGFSQNIERIRAC
jgi:hypothetical protein